MERKKNSTVKTRFTCAIVFIAFSCLYLTCWQGDVLAVAQHVLSKGMTTYNYVVAPFLITFALMLLQVAVYSLTRVKRRFHGLTYFPSLLVLAFITDVPNDPYRSLHVGAWWVVAPLLLVAFGVVMYVIRQVEPYEQDAHSNGWFSGYTWQNVAQLVVMMLLVCSVANNDRIFHQRVKMERLMCEERYEEALLVGRKSVATDSSLTMLRIACLHKTGKMGDQLFTYPLMGGSKAMVPDSVTVKALKWKSFKWMQPPTPWKKKHHLRNAVPTDYKLCALLLDKRLDAFVGAVQRYYRVDSTTLPKHYMEALTLYTHRRTHPVLVYRNAVMEADFQDYQALERKYADATQRQSALRDTYGNTYWYYYQYGEK